MIGTFVKRVTGVKKAICGRINGGQAGWQVVAVAAYSVVGGGALTSATRPAASVMRRYAAPPPPNRLATKALLADTS